VTDNAPLTSHLLFVERYVTALTMIPDVDQGKTIAVGVGSANYKGYQATALGASARITQNLKLGRHDGWCRRIIPVLIAA
jgi:hypothetical protein